MMRRFFRHENAVIAIILGGVIAMFAGLTRGAVLIPLNIKYIALESATRGIASIGQLFVILTAGIDLSVGGLALMTFTLCTHLITLEPRWQLLYRFGISTPFGGYGLPLAVGIIIMLLAGAGVGAANGLLVSRVRVPALIATLAMWQITRGGAYAISSGYHAFGIPEALAPFGRGSVAGVPVPVIVFVVLAVVAYFILHHTAFGKSVYAVGGNPAGAWLSGINVRRILLTVYVICGLLAALCGLIQLARIMIGSSTAGAGLELDSIAAVVIGGVSVAGGRGTLIGVVIGVFIIGTINNGMAVCALDPALQQIVKGAVIFAAVAFDVMRRRG